MLDTLLHFFKNGQATTTRSSSLGFQDIRALVSRFNKGLVPATEAAPKIVPYLNNVDYWTQKTALDALTAISIEQGNILKPYRKDIERFLKEQNAADQTNMIMIQQAEQLLEKIGQHDIAKGPPTPKTVPAHVTLAKALENPPERRPGSKQRGSKGRQTKRRGSNGTPAATARLG